MKNLFKALAITAIIATTATAQASNGFIDLINNKENQTVEWEYYQYGATAGDIISTNPLRINANLNNYPWDQASASFSNIGIDFSGLEKVEITYSSDKNFNMSLYSNLPNWSDNVAFVYELTAGTNKTATISLKDFPGYYLGDEVFTTSLDKEDKSKLSGFSFSASSQTQQSVDFTVNSAKLYGAKWKIPVTVTVTWGNSTLIYNGSPQVPTATSSNSSFPVTVSGAQTNFGTYTATATVQTPSAAPNTVYAVTIQNPTRQFTIHRLDVYPIWSSSDGHWQQTWDSPEPRFTYDGNPKTVTATSSDARFPLGEVIGGTQTNAGYYEASVSLKTPNNNINFYNEILYFSINCAQGYGGGVSLSGWRIGSPPNDPIAFSETNGNNATFTYKSIDNSYALSSSKPANPGTYIVRATFPQVPNYCSFSVESQFVISNRDAEPLEVVWTGQTKFQYNKMVQVPIPSAKNKNGEDIPLMVLNGHSAAGEYKGALAALAIIRDEWSRQFYYLTNNTKEYEISKKPLNVVIKDKNGNLKDTVEAELNSTNETALIAYVESILGYHGFATDTINNQTDNESVLRGKPRVVIENKTPRSLRNTDISEYLVKIETDDISADNYIIPQRNLNITINRNLVIIAADPRDITSIVKPQKSDNRYGIRFTQNIVSDKAEISIILPNSEKSAETKITIYDMTGNVVFVGAIAPNRPLIWNLINTAGRFVANGTYLVIAEVKSANGQRYHYSAKLGVKR